MAEQQTFSSANHHHSSLSLSRKESKGNATTRTSTPRYILAAPLGRPLGEAGPNPLRYAQAHLFCRLFVRLALSGRNPQFEPVAENLIRCLLWSAVWIRHTDYCTDGKYSCNPIDVRTTVRTILVAIKPVQGKQEMDA